MALANSVLDQFGIAHTTVGEAQTGYRNESYKVETADGPINLIIYKAEPGILERIRAADVMGEALWTKGLPVRHRVDQRTVQLKSDDSMQYAQLYNYLPGETIAWEAYSMNHLKLLGMVLAKLHSEVDELDLPLVTQECLQLLGRMQSYFALDGVQAAMQEKLGFSPPQLEGYSDTLKEAQELPGQQPLHMDFVRGNILFSKESSQNGFTLGSVHLTGIIDFEKAALGLPVFDIARTLAFLLVDTKHKTERDVRKYFLESGYIKRGQAIKNADLLEPLVNFFLIHDFYKFLLHNPYESLEQNEHYVRTRDILTAKGVL